MEFKSGFVTMIGRTNVGKSTLLNSLSNQKIAIISQKPQTTRNNIKAVITKENSQIIFFDTPGIHKSKNKLGEIMVKGALDSLGEVDAILFLTDHKGSEVGPGDKYVMEKLKSRDIPVFLVINKIDLLDKNNLLPIIQKYSEILDFKGIIPISALTGEGVDVLYEEMLKVIPEGPKYFPDDIITDQPERFIVAEMIREQILKLTNDEVPHGTGVEIISFKERTNKKIIDINADIYCEKKSHKMILIGKNGSMLKAIGSNARVEIEDLLGTKVFLQLWIKVKEDWRNKQTSLHDLGYR